MTNEDATAADVLAAITALRGHLDGRFDGVASQSDLVEIATDINSIMNTQDRQLEELIAFLKTRFDRIDARLEKLAATRQSVEMPALRQRVG